MDNEQKNHTLFIVYRLMFIVPMWEQVMGIRTLDQIELKGKRVFVRVDFNVPLNEKNEITDDTRILLSLPTIQFVMGAGGKAILSSHLGRPKGKRDLKFSL